ncbi:MAG: N-acetylglucosamine-6-phosphate deacetylase [Acidobacteria bacterium]|nr:N-acetylglucosamine-6-phosphate deacetylase [Acidobacteriota bacterium]
MVHTGRSPETGELLHIHDENGRILTVEETGHSGDAPYIAPGMIDIQVNGFAGVDYNSPLTPHDEIARSIEVIRSTGVTRFFPTVITSSNENTTGSLKNLAKAKRELSVGNSMTRFHVEGPWISPVDGPRGAHPVEHVRPATIDEWKQFEDAAEGNIGILTLAPEQEGAIPLIEHIAAEGRVVVALGHCNANTAQIKAAIQAGATMSTHLGNGSHQVLARFPNYIIDQMASDELCAGLIVDGIHLDPNFVKIAVRAKGLDKSILITDAVSPANCPPGIYRIGDLEVELTAENRVELTSSRRLAGSALCMDQGLANLIRFAGISLYQALRMATVNAAVGARLEHRQRFLEPGDLADLILFDHDAASGDIHIRQTICSPLS